MKKFQFVAVALVMFLALGIGSVYANSGEANLGLPILGTTANPSPSLGAPALYSGIITVLYASGTPVVLEFNAATLDVCNANSCVTVTAMLKQTAPGTYTYSFTPPTSITGTDTIYVKAYALSDDNGKIFPQIDTSVGSYVFAPSSATSSSVPAASAPAPVAMPVTPPPQLTAQAVKTQPTQTTETSPIEPLLIILSALAVVGSLLTISKPH